MPNLVQGFGPEGFEPSGGPQVMSAEQKLESMLRTMGGAPNAVLMMIARILKSGEGAGQPQPRQQWNSLYQMPPAQGPQHFPGINIEPNVPSPMRPSEPPVMLNPNPGFIRG